MDVDNSVVLPQERLEDALKQTIPVQNVRLERIGGVDTHILVWVFRPEPLGAIVWKGTIDDVGDASFIHELGGQVGSRSHENPRMEVGRRLSEILGDGNQHYRDRETSL
jgi:hypothetical protein